MCIPHIFFIHSFIHGHLGCFHVFAIVNSAAVNTGMHDLFELWFSPDICPEVGLLDHMVLLFLVFKGSISTLFIVAVHSGVPVEIPSNSVRGFL